MPEIKVGQDVLVRGRVEEIRITATGQEYKIRFAESQAGADYIIVPPKVIVE